MNLNWEPSKSFHRQDDCRDGYKLGELLILAHGLAWNELFQGKSRLVSIDLTGTFLNK